MFKKRQRVQGKRCSVGWIDLAQYGSRIWSGMVDVEISWSLEGPLEVLLDATRAAHIDPNAVNGGVIDADLTFPSFFCTSRASWVKALAYLFVRNIRFRLFLVGSTEDGGERWRYQVLPAMDDEMISLMREIDTAEALELNALSERVERVVERLRAVDWEESDLLP